jgi:hypothetical protein
VALVPSTASARAKADLRVTSLKVEHLGKPRHLLIIPNGDVEAQIVDFTTTNFGRKAAAHSYATIDVRSRHGRWHQLAIVRVPRIAPKDSVASSELIDPFEEPPGFVRFRVVADAGEVIDESDERNNDRKGPEIPAIPFTYNVQDFTLTSANAIGEERTGTLPGFQFVFDHGDRGAEQFVYHAYGKVTNKQLSTPKAPCTITGSATASGNPWASSFLRVDADLEHYDGLIATATQPSYFATVTCSGSSFPVQVVWPNLDTFVAVGKRPQMRPHDIQLSGATDDGTTAWDWVFKARLDG